MKKIAFIGAGAAKFVRANIVNFLAYPELRDAGFELHLMDINPERLGRARAVVERMIREKNAAYTVRTTTDMAEAIDGADLVMITVMVGGPEALRNDIGIPAKHGVLQAVGDTIGPGAVMRAVRTAPVLERIAAGMSRGAPESWVINYANPLSMLTRILIVAGHRKSVGLCHSIGTGVREIGSWLDIPAGEIDYVAAGLNHINFYLTLSHRGRDLYPDLLANADRIIRESTQWEADAWGRVARGHERVRMELTKYLGHFPAEGPWHQGDFYPWFRKNKELLDAYGPKEGWSLEFDKILAERGAAEIDKILSGEEPIDYTPGHDCGVKVVHSLLTGTRREIYANVPNDGLIGNLPPEAVVEVPCALDGTGLTPSRCGRIPPQLAAVMMPHAAVHELTLAAIREKSIPRLRQAIQADPLTGAVLTLPQIDAMTAELFAANADHLKDWTTGTL